MHDLVNDATVKGGTYYPITVKKHLRAQEIADKIIYLVFIWWIQVVRFYLHKMKYFPIESILAEFFIIKHNMSASKYSANCCGDGIMYCRWCLCSCYGRCIDYGKNQATIFLGGPPLVKAATGEVSDR